MLQVFWRNMPDLASVRELISPRGEVVLLGGHCLRLSPSAAQYPVMYFNRGGLIEVLLAEGDLFYQSDCLEILEQWLGEAVVTSE